MTVTKKEAQATLDAADHLSPAQRKVFQSLIDAMPPDPETRAERLGRVCFEGFYVKYEKTDASWYESAKSQWTSAAAAVEAECPKPRAVTGAWLSENQAASWGTFADRINRYVRGEDA